MIGVLLLLGACTTPAAPQEWAGVSTDANGDRALALRLNRAGTRAFGEYTVGVSTGALEGTIENGSIFAELTAGPTCTYQFQGSMTESVLTGSYSPDDCAGGLAGTWNLSRP
ncbi:MAG TPA: hypothetical protein VFN03_12560 [Trueperaceae bacterium]|nr:hypothetical protein [Trueperaceae bacterium]